MLRLRPFDLLQPRTLDAVLGLLAQHGPRARLIAGGTDLLPNLKLGHGQAEVLVSLRQVEELQGITCDNGSLRIGACTRLDAVARDDDVRQLAAILAQAAAYAASPQIRRMGTLGGNLCLDTRCRYINQSPLFREALGGCLKSHGKECHVVPGGQGCVAALSADTVPSLVACEAAVEIAGPGGRRSVPVAELYGTDGLRHVRIEPGEILVAIRVPAPRPGSRYAARKWAVRRSIDFPLISLAMRLDIRSPADGPGVLEGGILAIGVLGPRPRLLDLGRLAGAPCDESLAAALGRLAWERSRPLPNVPYDPAYRRERLEVEVRRAALGLLA